ncbi:MAG: DUF5684 domain-containing protein [Bacteroidota bacterium]
MNKPQSYFLSLALLLGLSLFSSPAQAQLGLLKNLGKAAKTASKAGKAGKAVSAVRMSRLARTSVLAGGGFMFGDDILRVTAGKLDEVVALIQVDDGILIMRANIPSLMDEGADLARLKPRESFRGKLKNALDSEELGFAKDVTEEALDQAVSYVIDEAAWEEEEIQEQWEELPQLRFKGADSVTRPIRKWATAEGDIAIFQLFPEHNLWVRMEDREQISLLKGLKQFPLARQALSFQPPSDRGAGPYVLLPMLLDEIADSSGLWLVAMEDNQQVQAQYFLSAVETPQQQVSFASPLLAGKMPEGTLLQLPPESGGMLWPGLIGILGLWLIIAGINGLCKIFHRFGNTSMQAALPFYNLFKLQEILGQPIWKAVLLLIPGLHFWAWYQTHEQLRDRFGFEEKWVSMAGAILPYFAWWYWGRKLELPY